MQAGDKLTVLIKKGTGWQSKKCTYVSETDKTILVDTGKYKDTINKVDIKCNQVKIEFLEGEGMYAKEPKITREQLLKECRKLGTGKEAREAIAEKYGLTEGTIQNYIYKRWNIMDELNTSKDNKENPTEQIHNQHEDQQLKDKNNGVDEKNGEKSEKMINVIKDSQSSVSNQDSLEILSMTIKGKNGIYKTCENGIELSKNGCIMFFEKPEEVDEFAEEYKAVFAKIKK